MFEKATLKFATGAATAAAVAAAMASVVALAGPAHADASQVVINEIMYHAPDADPVYANVEFIELTNAGSTDVDVSGWTFSNGITPTAPFAAGTVIAAGGYLVGTSDTALFQSKYGFPANFSYAGTSLSNGGEQVTLVDSTGAVVDDVTYDDSSPWVTAPDGGGPSLELDSPTADNSVATNWHASGPAFGTPGAANSPAPLALSGVTVTPAQPDPGQPFLVQATAVPGATMTLDYKVMYGADVVVPMLDDASSPGGADDGVFAATVPATPAGQLVRYKVSASKGTASASYPAVGDSRPYDGVVVKDPSLQAQFPVLQWFMPDAVYQDMIAHHRCDGVTADATFAWNGKVLDGGAMNIKGHSSCSDPKAKWNVEMPAGYTFDFGAPFKYPVAKFDLQNESVPIPRIGWEMIGQTNSPTAAYQTMRIQRNGQFFGVFGVLENYDSIWRQNNGLGNAPFYKVEAGGLRTAASAAALEASGDVEKKNPDDGDYTDIWQLTQELALPASPARTAWLHAHLDLPQLANYTALTVVMRHWDSGSKNYYLARDAVTGRWQVYSWDLDGIFNNATDPKGDFVFPDTSSGTQNQLWKALYSMPDFRAMHFRRVRTLSDQFLTGGGLVARFDALTAPYANDIALDRSVWGKAALATFRTKMVNAVQERRNQVAKHTSTGEIPASQAAGMNLVINEINYQPAAGGSEYVELYNPNAASVDLSGWTMPAVGLTAQPGTIIAGHGYLLWTRDDAALRATYGDDLYVADQYPNALSDSGESVELFDGTRLVDSVPYSPTAPWPNAAGTGHSLELISPTADNSDPANWALSPGTGSPGAANGTTTPTTTTVLDFGQSWRYLSTSADQGTAWRAPTYNDSTWASGVAPLGFRSTQATTIPFATGRLTYYFRNQLSVAAGATPTAVTLTLMCDDGCAVYLNGSEVTRTNLPAGALNYKTKAVSSIGTVKPLTFNIPVGSLVLGGSNSIAVEVHNRAAGSGADLLFDARLTVTR